MGRTLVSILLATLTLSGAAGAPPQRVVSLDYCADQYVLKMLPRANIAAVSPDADSAYSYMREQAVGVPTIRPIAEDVIALQPDLIVRSYGGGPHAARFFESAGLDVLQVPYVDGVASIAPTVLHMAEKLGVPSTGQEIVARMNDRLRHIADRRRSRTALYLTPFGATSGPDTMIHDLLDTAGLANFERRPGWREIDLERLAYEQPDVVAAAFFDDRGVAPQRWSAMRHPIARRQLAERKTVYLQGAWTSCGGWFLVDAIEALAHAVTAP